MTDTSPPVVEIRDFEDPRRFLDALRTSNDEWQSPGHPLPVWVFRGHADAEWGLVPSALRDDAWRGLPDILRKGREHADYEIQVLRQIGIGLPDEALARAHSMIAALVSEVHAVRLFAQLADELAFALDTIPWEVFAVVRDFIDCGWRPENWWAHLPRTTTALAQHHGVPTRLLDWTRRPWNAALFAASDVMARRTQVGKCAEHLAVWGLNLDCPIDGMDIVVCPRHRLGYMHAQDGLFTHHESGMREYILEGRPLDLVHRAGDFAVRRPVLRKYTLPTSCAEPLLKQLWLERVSLAHMMPTLDNVAAMMRLPWVQSSLK